MCSFIFSTKEIVNLDLINRVTKFRGPDLTTHQRINGLSYVHNLLSITGVITPQPFVRDNVVCIYNGEIYNHTKFGDFQSDGECLIEAYKKYGVQFTKELDGEFAIVLVDYNEKIILFSSDTFKTKPIFFSVNGCEMGVSTYSEPLKLLGFNNIKKVTPNKTFVFDLETKVLKDMFTIVDFDIKNQHKKDMNDWVKSFEDSITKRAKGTRENVFMGLSSGYDSGAICCELLKQNISFKVYTMRGTENENILEKRFQILNQNEIDYTILNKSDSELQETIRYIKKNTEEFKYTICSSSSSYNEYYLSLTDDGGSKHLSYISKIASQNGNKILLSGGGADEIFSDYGFGGKKLYQHSNFGGLFPKNLETIFPWNSFYHSSMESYLAKDEYVGGSFGLEVRYPFLDKQVVQEFLWLDVELKNKSYKYPLEYYLEVNNFPFNKGEKLGF
jgi:asparagine synthase (glutamine-hydrolysing)